MENNAWPMVCQFQEGTITVHRHLVANQPIYRAEFSDKRPPLIIAGAIGADGQPFWTSIPEGRLPEANDIGTIILSAI